MQLVDLSAPIEPSPPELLEPLKVKLEYSDHAAGAAQIEALFGVPAGLLRDGEGWANDEFTQLGTHSSTHVDAPWHYNSTIRGEPAKRIDELPLEWFFADGVRLDDDRPRGRRGDHGGRGRGRARPHRPRAKPLDIVLVHTGRDEFYGSSTTSPAAPASAPRRPAGCYERGVRVMGIDAWGWDRPLHLQAAEAIERDEPGIFWEAHQADLRVFADRAPGQPRRAPRHRVQGRLLSAADRRRQRRAGSGRGDRSVAPRGLGREPGGRDGLSGAIAVVTPHTA